MGWDRTRAMLTVGLVAAMGCTSETSPDEVLVTRGDEIVGGQPESRWSGIGALVRTTPEDGYRGVFCSATVIAPRWALTAAHCIRTEDFEPFPEEVQLYLGPDARPTANGDPPTTGSLHQAGGLVAHPSYARGRDFDVGLVYLAEPAEDRAAPPLSEAPLTNWSIDVDVLHVGYGVDDAEAVTGSGSKRSVVLPLTGYEDGFFFSEPDGRGFCFGDSGGPAILEAEGDEPRIAGIASRFEGEPSCVGGVALSTRVDANLDWIESTIAAPPPGCDTYEGRCRCEAACRSDGTCDVSACEAPADEGQFDEGGCAMTRYCGPRSPMMPWFIVLLGGMLARRRKRLGGL